MPEATRGFAGAPHRCVRQRFITQGIIASLAVLSYVVFAGSAGASAQETQRSLDDALSCARQAVALREQVPEHEYQVQLIAEMFRAVAFFGDREARQIATWHAVESDAVPPPAVFRDAVRDALQKYKIWFSGTTAGELHIAPRSHFEIGELTRTVHEGARTNVTRLEAMVSDEAHGLVSAGAWTVGTILPLADLQLEPSVWRSDPGTSPRAVGYLRIVAVDTRSDRYDAEFLGIAADVESPGPFLFLRQAGYPDAYRFRVNTLVPRGLEIRAQVTATCGNAEEFSVTGGAWPGLDIQELEVWRHVSLPYPIEMRVGVVNEATGEVERWSNSLWFNLYHADVQQQRDNCATVLCLDRSDSDGDGVGDRCDNCPLKANADQIDRNGDGLGDACQVTDAASWLLSSRLRIEPNPTPGPTTIHFQLHDAMPVNVELYDVRGRLVRVTRSGALPAGAHRVLWDGRDTAGHALGQGIYFVRMRTPSGEQRAKLSVVRR